MANEPQQLYDSDGELATQFSSSGRPLSRSGGGGVGLAADDNAKVGGNPLVASAGETESAVDGASGSGVFDVRTDVRESNATTAAGRARDAAADIAGARAYRAGAAKLGKGLGVDVGAQKDGLSFRPNRESIGNMREAFAQGRADRAGGQKSLREGVREQNQARIAKSATGSASAGIAQGAGKQLGKEAAKDTAQAVAKTGGKAVPGLGLAASVDVKGLENTAKDTARELANLRVGKAAKRLVTGLGKSAAITIFRASYDPYVIGFTGSLSLIATFLLGSVLFFVPGSLTTFERLIVAMVWGLILVILCIILAVVVISTCSGLNVPGIVLKFASIFSTSAAAIDSVCSNASILTIIKGL